MLHNLRLLVLLTFTIQGFASLANAEPIRVGVSLALSGEAATFGLDMKNALTLAHEDLGKERYELIFEDDRCLGKDAANVAHKLINVDKVKYVVGIACNQVLLSSAPIYEKAGVTVISGFGTSGDVKGIGKQIFRLFPADQHAAEVVYPYVAARHKSLGVITEDNEYPELIRRTLERLHRESQSPLSLLQESFKTDDKDLRQVLLRFKAKQAEALFLNPNAEPSFIRLMQQLEHIHYSPTIYSVFWPSATVVQQTLGKKLEGIVFGNLPANDVLLSKEGQDLIERFRKRFGEPNSVPNGVAFAYETLRLLDKALKSGKAVHEYLHQAQISDGMIGNYSFDADGAVQGLRFELQEVRNGTVQPLRR